MNQTNRYESGQIVAPWFLFDQPKRFQIDPQLSKDLYVEFATRGERNPEQELALSDRLYNQYLKGSDYKRGFQTFLNLCATISEIHRPLQKQNPFNKKRSVAVMNGVMATLAEQVTMDTAEQVPDSYVKNLVVQAQMVEGAANVYDVWFNPKLYILQNSLRRWKEQYKIMDEMKKRVNVQVEGSTKEDFAQSADEIWQETLENQKYGVKTCYFDSPMFLKGENVFYVVDGSMGVDDKVVQQSFLPDIEAVVCIGKRPTKQIKTEVERREQKKKGVTVARDSIYIARGDAFEFFPVFRDGQISSVPVGLFPLSRAFEKKGMGKEYEYWRMFMMMRLHDLVVSTDQVGKYPSIDVFEWDAIKKEKSGFLGLKGKQHQLDYKKLVLPRKVPPEPEEKPETAPAAEKRFVDKHNVTWFKRKLPQGYHATERAIQYAAEHDLLLSEGETIVREHERGNRNPVAEKPHKAVFNSKTFQ